MTVVGRALARVGTEFQYTGKVRDCYGCKLERVCHAQALEERAWYRVTRLRGVRHPASVCGVFDGDVEVVEVEPVSPIGSVPTQATRGTGTRWAFIECEHVCPFKRYCQSDALTDGALVEIGETLGRAEPCKKGLDLTLARLRET